MQEDLIGGDIKLVILTCRKCGKVENKSFPIEEAREMLKESTCFTCTFPTLQSYLNFLNANTKL